MQIMNESIHRLIDANINRAVEGIRVLEEAARMVLDDAELTGCIKDIRHTLIQVVKSEKKLSRFLLTSRGSDHDVLRSGETVHERHRGTILSVIEANAGRAQEALRVIEEYGKLLYPSLSGRFKAIRFSLYDIEKEFAVRLGTQCLLSRERLGVIVILVHKPDSGSDPGDCAKAYIDEGAGTIAFSDSISQDGRFLKHAERVLGATEDGDVKTLICDRLDCALIVGADGILLSQNGLPVDACKGVANPSFIIGYTEPWISDHELAIREDSHFVVIDLPNAAKYTKDRHTNCFSERVKAAQLPVIALGDFSAAEAEILLSIGFTGIAVKSDHCSIPSFVNIVKVLRTYGGETT